jgi:myo-inositol-1(or 4)-monophosphatase
MKELAWLATQAGEVARFAGELLKARPQEVHHKGAIDLVTEVDLASETRIREEFGRRTPELPVQGEEAGGVSTGLRWVVDPLDGTTNFVHGYPFYCVSIGLVDGQKPVVGALYDPVRDRLLLGWEGGGSWDGEQRLRVSETRNLGDTLGITGFPYKRRDALDYYLRFVKIVLQKTQGMRRSGSAAMDLGTITRGQADFFWEFGLNPWDTAAGAILVREAGGVVCRLDGQPWVPEDPEIIASNPWILEDLLEMLRVADRQ